MTPSSFAVRLARCLHGRVVRHLPPRARADIVAILRRELAAPSTARGWIELPDVVPDAIRTPVARVHDADYLVLGAFTDPATTIVDVGANHGYSASSMWAAGARTAVLSFEPNPRLAAHLRRLAHQHPGRFDFRAVALDAAPSTIELATPIVNGVVATALATADPDPELDGLARNVEDFAAALWPGGRCHTLRIRRFAARATTLDLALAAPGLAVPVADIVAIKIDTEGLEARVLAGARDTLARHRPLLLIETGRSYPSCVELCRALGYVPARRAGRQLHAGDGVPLGANMFFVHADRIGGYRALGMWRDA